MSAKARDWAYSVKLPLCQKFVLVALAERANDEGHAWPSIGTITKMTGASERTVRRAIRSLESENFITCLQGNGRSNNYKLNMSGEKKTTVSAAPTPVTQSENPGHCDRTAPVTVTPTPVTQSENPGHCDPQTVKNRQEPTRRAAPCVEDWVSANWMRIGNDVLAITGQNPANSMAPTGIVRQWLADARTVGYSLATAREVILETVRQRCERGSGRGKAPAWFDKPVREAIASGVMASSAPELPADSRAIQDAYRDHVVWCSNHREKRKPFPEFEAEWRERHAA